MDDFKPEKHEDIIIYRSEAEMAATCPHQRKLSKQYPRELQDDMPTVGVIGHELIEEAIKTAIKNRGQSDEIADYFVQEVSKTRPDLSPQVIDAYKGVVFDLLYLSIAEIIGCEMQVDHVLLPATKSRGRVVISTRLDLLQSGFDGSLIWRDWKSGWKRRNSAEAWQSFQGQFITYLLWQAYDGKHKTAEGEALPKVDDITGYFHETRFGKTVESKYSRDKHPWRLNELTQENQFLGRITEAVRLILTDCDEAWPSEKKCLWCNWLDKCEYANKTALDFVERQEEFIYATHVMELLVKQNKQIIKDYILGGGVCEYEFMTAQKKTPAERFTLEIKDSRVIKKKRTKI